MSSPGFGDVSVPDSGPSNRCGPPYFHWQFLNIFAVEQLFICSLAISMSSSRGSFKVLALFLNLVVIFLTANLFLAF